MSVKVHDGWELQWRPASGALPRRLVVSRPAARNAMLALGVCGLVLVGSGLLAGRDGNRAPAAIGTARFENDILKARQDALRERASLLLDRLEAMDDNGAPLSATWGRRLAFGGARPSVR